MKMGASERADLIVTAACGSLTHGLPDTQVRRKLPLEFCFGFYFSSSAVARIRVL